jgi:pimeloyl-ACP methyl ester carboxylesterase
VPDDAYKLDGLWDLVLCYEELLDALGLERAALVGHSFGAMVACELAAAYPRRARGLVLIDPIGLWREAAPIVNWMMLNPADLPAHIFSEPKGEAAQRLLGAPDDENAGARLRLMWAMGATGKFIWPLPDKGLKKRIHRVKASTLLVWGKEDRLVPPSYADEFARCIPGARVQTVERAGHAPHLERPEPVARMLREFLTGAT